MSYQLAYAYMQCIRAPPTLVCSRLEIIILNIFLIIPFSNSYLICNYSQQNYVIILIIILIIIYYYYYIISLGLIGRRNGRSKFRQGFEFNGNRSVHSIC